MHVKAGCSRPRRRSSGGRGMALACPCGPAREHLGSLPAVIHRGPDNSMGNGMIALGTYDPTVSKTDRDAYQALVRTQTGVYPLEEWKTQLRDEGRWVGYTPLPAGEAMTVAELQRFLTEAGFRASATDNGICGYRTAAAIFLFQEYVRTVEGISAIGYPDGRFGKVTLSHVQRWQAAGLRADWTALSPAEPSPEHAQLIRLLNAAKARCTENPGATLSKVNAAPACATRKVADWDFDPAKIHLVGVRRRRSAGAVQNLDDPFKLLIRGLVFTFYGSTEPGTKTDDAAKYPYLVPGQHRYRLGWHHQSNKVKIFRALKPVGDGVWVQRANKLIATDAELEGPLDGPNNSINIHWGGGGADDRASWSAGCQVIAGKSYSNHHGQVIDCEPFAAAGYAGLGANDGRGNYLSKGAVTMMENLVAAFSGSGADDRVVHYTLLTEDDLALEGEQFASQTLDLLQQLRTA
jgi:peptidoglycan hydrolase-like protein with peptidoglycan-binding domain